MFRRLRTSVNFSPRNPALDSAQASSQQAAYDASPPPASPPPQATQDTTALPLIEESVTAEGQPGSVVGSFEYPDFEARLPPEVAGVADEEPPIRQVVVVGADPAGLTLALILVRQGIAVTLLDPRRTLASSSHSATWSALTLELWARCGVLDAALAAAVPRRMHELLLAGHVGAQPQLVARSEVEGRAGRWVAPCAMHLQQYRVEQLLHDALVTSPQAGDLVDVRWQTTVEDVVAKPEGVLLKVSVPDASHWGTTHKYELRTGYAVVCNSSMKAVVRNREATPRRSAASPVVRTVLTMDLDLRPGADAYAGADRRTLLAGLSNSDERNVASSGIGGLSWLAVSQRTHPDGQIRLDAVLPAGVDLSQAARADSADALAKSMLGSDAPFTVRSCAARTFRAGPMSSASQHGRLFFCGDALAVLSPFGGAAGNLGVQDAANLAWKLALVVLQGAPPALLETYQAEREAVHRIAMQWQLHAEQVLAPATAAHHEARRVAAVLLQAGQDLGAAFLACASALPPTARIETSPLFAAEVSGKGKAGSSFGAPFDAAAPAPGEAFADCAVEDLELEVDDEVGALPSPSHGFLLGHTGAFFTLIIFVLTVEDIPWDSVKLLDRSKLQLTLELVRKVVVILDAKGLERMSDAHVAAVGRARRLGVRLLADRGGSAAGAYDARPGTTLLVRPDLHMAASWRELRPREVQEAFLRATGHLLHAGELAALTSSLPQKVITEAANRQTWTPSPPHSVGTPRAQELEPQAGSTFDKLFAVFTSCLANTPAEARLGLAMGTALLLADKIGKLDVVIEALGSASLAAALQPGDSGAHSAGHISSAGESSPRTVEPLQLHGTLAQLFEVVQPDFGKVTLQQPVGPMLASWLPLSNDAQSAARNFVASPQDLPGLVPPDAAVEALGRLLQNDPQSVLAFQPPPRGTPDLRARVAKEISAADGVEIAAEDVLVAEGPAAALARLLIALLCDTSPPLESPAKLGVPSNPQVCEVLLVGPCPEAWWPVLSPWRVRRCDLPPGDDQNFAFSAEDVARQVSLNTRVILMPMYSLVTGLAPRASELSRLGHFIDYEVERRLSQGFAGDAGKIPLALIVDVTLRSKQLDAGVRRAGRAATVEHLPVLVACRHSAVIGDIFGEWSPAPGLHAQYAAPAIGLADTMASANASVDLAGTGSGAALVQGLAAALPVKEAGSGFEGLRRRREVLCDALARAGLGVVGGRPRAGHFACARLPEDVDEDAYCAALVRCGMKADAGTKLGYPGCVRLSFAGRFDALEASLPALGTALREVRRQQKRRPAALAAAALEAGTSAETAANAGTAAPRPGSRTPSRPPSRPGSRSPRLSRPGSRAGSRPGSRPASHGDVAFADRMLDGPAEMGNSGDRDGRSDAGPSPAKKVLGGADDLEGQEVESDAGLSSAPAEEVKSAVTLATQLRQGAKALACAVQLGSGIATALIAEAGFEVIVIDHEYGPGDVGSTADLVRSAHSAGAYTILRLPAAEASHIQSALDAGVNGVLLPRVLAATEAEAFVALVEAVARRVRDEDSLEWNDEEGTAANAPSTHVPGAVQRPLIAVEIDPGASLVADAVLEVAGLDLVLIDPERTIAALSAVASGPGSGNKGSEAAGSNEAEAAAGGGQADDKNGAKLATAEHGTASIAQPRYGGLAPVARPFVGGSRTILKSPNIVTPNAVAAVAEAQQLFWSKFESLPMRAAEQHKLVGCCSHARNTPIDLLAAGHSIVVMAADLELLREAALRHTDELKAERPGQQVSFVTPLESARARLASGALVSQLRRQKKALGAFLHLGDPLTAETVCLGGFEVVVLDHEQGPGDLLNAVSLIHAAASAGAHTLFRVPALDETYLRRALQLGAEGIILPRTESAQQAAEFVTLTRRCWPSSSLRGGGLGPAAMLRPAVAASAQHLRRRGEELLLKACQVETERGLSAVESIVQTDGVDMIFFAPVELAACAARGREAGLLTALELAEGCVKQAGKLLGGMLLPGRSLQQMFLAGYDVVCTTSDVILMRTSAENSLNEAKPPASHPKAGNVRWVLPDSPGQTSRKGTTLVARLRKNRKECILGVVTRLASAAAAETAARAGFETIVLDHEHGPGDLLGAVGLIHAAARSGSQALIRVPALDHGYLRRAMQIGIDGVILPHIESAQDAHRLVEMCIYPTKHYKDNLDAEEVRMACQPFRRMDFSFAPPLVAFYGERAAEFARRQGEAVLIAAQVDTPKGAAAASEIAQVPGIDMIFIDALRLSASEVEHIEDAAKAAGKLLGGLIVPGCSADQMFQVGYQLVCAASDRGLLMVGARACLRAVRDVPSAPAAKGPARESPVRSQLSTPGSVGRSARPPTLPAPAASASGQLATGIRPPPLPAPPETPP